MDRPKRPHLRRILKWTGLIGCVLIVVVWGVNLRWALWRCEADWALGLYGGDASVWWGDSQMSAYSAGQWVVEVASPSKVRYGFRYPRAYSSQSPYPNVVTLPFWLPLLILAVPTAILWRRDRRRIPPGHCGKCGYDLTGNESGVCPECGTGIARAIPGAAGK